MRRLLFVFALLLLCFASVTAVSAAPTCFRATGIFTNLDVESVVINNVAWNVSGSIVQPANPDYVYVQFGRTVTQIWEETFDSPTSIFLSFEPVLFSSGDPATVDFDITIGACGGALAGGPAGINDGRVNNGPGDLAAPAAAFCQNRGMDIYSIDGTGRGSFAFSISREAIDAALEQAKATGVNVLIAESGGTSLYALSSNELTLVGHDVKEPGKLYMRIMSPNTCA